MIEELTKRGAEVVAFDPEASDNVRQQIGDVVQYADSKEATLAGADALILMTEWQHFRKPDRPR